MFFLSLSVAIVVFVVLRMGGDAVGPLPCPALASWSFVCGVVQGVMKHNRRFMHEICKEAPRNQLKVGTQTSLPLFLVSRRMSRLPTLLQLGRRHSLLEIFPFTHSELYPSIAYRCE